MKAADYLAEFLRVQDVGEVFEVVGGMITHLLDAMHRKGAPRVVTVHHEQAASFAADAVGRLTGRPGVALATSGPGAVNLLTGVGSCYFDSSPAVFITGQVNVSEQKGARPIRQLGFQETDIVAMAAPITKAALRVGSAQELPARLEEAFRLAISGRPGPVLLDIPMDVQRMTVNAAIRRVTPAPAASPGRAEVSEAARSLAKARRPLILAGGGIRAAVGAREAVRRVAERLGVPVVQSLMGLGSIPSSHPLCAGFIGSYGNRWANLALGRADLLLVVGSRLDIRQTGSDTEFFKQGRDIIHVDCDPGEINNRIPGCRPIVADVGRFLALLDEEVTAFTSVERVAWLKEISALRAAHPDADEISGIAGINPNVFMHSLSRASTRALGYLVDVGQHQMWAAQSLELGAEQTFMTSGGMGAMGFALPGAIGAATVRPGPWVMIAGDGGFQLNLQELQTVYRNRLPLKMVILNNRCHGMVRQFQESYFDKRYGSTFLGYSAPEFARIARAYGIAAAKVGSPKAVNGALTAMWRDPAEPYLLEVYLDTYANAYPKIAFGRPLTEMEPDAKPLDMEGT